MTQALAQARFELMTAMAEAEEYLRAQRLRDLPENIDLNRLDELVDRIEDIRAVALGAKRSNRSARREAFLAAGSGPGRTVDKTILTKLAPQWARKVTHGDNR